MKNRKIAVAMILLFTTITTAFALLIFYSMFFFLGFLNPIIFAGTAPILLLNSYVRKGKKKCVIVCWIIATLFLVIATSIMIFIVGSPMFSGGFRF